MPAPRSTLAFPATLALALLALPAARAQDAAPVAAPSQPASLLDGREDPAELAAFRSTLERYKERMREFVGDTRAIVDQAEAEERSKISQSYGAAMNRLEDSEDTLRRVAIAKLESFLQKYPDAAMAADMKFRLADLYYEESEVEFLARMEEYNRLEDQLAENPGMVLPEPPLKDYRASVALYRDIVENHRDYAYLVDTLYMLGWCYGAQNAEQYDELAARDVYASVVRDYPDSPFANDANMRLGEYYFDLPGTRESPTVNVSTAITYYEAVLADGPEGRNFDEAVYKLGWSHYKLNEYDRALAYLVQLLDYSDEQFLQTGRISNMRPEAVEYLAISYSDIADRQFRKPVEVATAHLDRVGDRKWQHDVIVRLAQILVVQAKFDAAIETFGFLQDRWPLDPENPVYQNEIAKIYMTQPLPDPEAAAKALAVLSERYTEGTPWYDANRNNPDAVATARGFIETSLAAVATEHLLAAKETGDIAEYKVAADKYREFLDKFPFADDYDTYEWYLALALFESNQFRDAERQYLQILKNERSPFRDGARFQLMKAREQIVLSTYGSLENVPQGAIVEKAITTPSGQQVTRYMLSDEHKAFIASADDLMTREFTDPDWAPILERDRAALAYLPAQIVFNHGHYDEARARFDKVIALYPNRDEAAYAAGLYIATYQNEGDLEKVRQYTGKFASMQLGSEAVRRLKQAEFETIQEQAAFMLAYQLIDKGDRAGAAQAYVDFMREFPTSKYSRDALYNAANNFEAIGKADESNRLFEQYVQQYPSDDRSKYLYFRIASNYSAILELDRSVQYFEALPKLFPDFEDSPAALYNAAFLRVGLGDHAGAARAFERYASQYPDQADAESVFWRAGEQWELVGESEALDFYQRYLKRYAAQDPDHAIEAWYRVAGYYARRGDKRRNAQAWASLQEVFRNNAAGTLTQRSRSLAAEGALSELLAGFEAFQKYKFTGNEKKDVELVIKTKPEELKLLTDKAVQMIQTYQDFETASASLYVQGMAYFAYADMVFNVPPPPGLTDEEIVIYQTQLDNLRIPAEDRGKARLTASLEKAQAEKHWSEWNSKALKALNARFPFDYPSERAESRGSISPSVIPMAGPATIEAPEKEPAR